jgi:hypothetical protein
MGVVQGTMKDVVTKEIQKILANMHPDARKVLQMLIPAIVDTTLHHLLWTIEQEQRLGLTMDGSPQLRDVSDGLPGDYVGWKDRLSKQRQFPPPKAEEELR